MDLNSPIFLFLFLPIFLIIYYLVPGRAKLFVGIAGSLIFYSQGNLKFLPLIAILTLFAYLLAIWIERLRGQSHAFILLWFGIFANIALLIGYKLAAETNYPLGLSYVTFQVIAYLVEVYNGVAESEKDLTVFTFYLLLFPKIPVGPIVRYRQMREQIQNLKIDPSDAADGLRRFVLGFAKKALIADTLLRVVTPVFDLDSPIISPQTAWLVILCYSLQLYFDFSGYTDMAIGLGRMMGLTFIENFNLPYLSKSIGEFWRRWHISLSVWFRDMVFYPLERRRFIKNGQPFHILFVFVLTGLWHGLTANFIIWGGIHALALIFESSLWGRKLRDSWASVQHIYALGIILAGWVFFRSPTPGFALQFLLRLLGYTNGLKTLPFELTSPLPFLEPTFLLALAAGLLFSLPLAQWTLGIRKRFSMNEPGGQIFTRFLYDLVLIFIFWASIASTASGSFHPGIYNNF